jgi:hypothetical protein
MPTLFGIDARAVGMTGDGHGSSRRAWMLKRVQHDELKVGAATRILRRQGEVAGVA